MCLLKANLFGVSILGASESGDAYLPQRYNLSPTSSL